MSKIIPFLNNYFYFWGFTGCRFPIGWQCRSFKTMIPFCRCFLFFWSARITSVVRCMMRIMISFHNLFRGTMKHGCLYPWVLTTWIIRNVSKSPIIVELFLFFRKVSMMGRVREDSQSTPCVFQKCEGFGRVLACRGRFPAHDPCMCFFAFFDFHDQPLHVGMLKFYNNARVLILASKIPVSNQQKKNLL